MGGFLERINLRNHLMMFGAILDDNNESEASRPFYLTQPTHNRRLLEHNRPLL